MGSKLREAFGKFSAIVWQAGSDPIPRPQALGAGLLSGPATSFFGSTAGDGFAVSALAGSSDFLISPELFQKLLNDMEIPHEIHFNSECNHTQQLNNVNYYLFLFIE
ncbi:hypothetical protein [Thalassobaculum salexigens]|uniref:hypothetical protein n=1 Tax=Thalassobaculum salexigens TaxID=455360 RepID=UPI00146E9B07|nr:hypothetical protein [Thalassobaculum salexigens]